MADGSYTPLVSKSITNFSLFLPNKNISPNRLFPFPSLSFSHSNFSRRPTNKRKQLHLTCFCSPNSPDFDIISTHEHNDGSLMFRFGDPSEVVKIDQLSETNSENEETEGEDNVGYSVVNVLDGDHKREVIVKNIDSNIKSSDLVEVVDEANYVAVSSRSNNVFEKENSLIETSSSTSSEIEQPVSISVIEDNISSQSIAEVGDVESIELNRASGSSSINVEIPVSLSTTEENESSGSISEIEDVERVEESIEMNDSSSTVVKVEDAVHEDVEKTSDSSESEAENVVDMEEESPIDRVENESSSTLEASTLTLISGPENQGASLETQEPGTDSTSSHESASVKLDSHDQVIDDVHQEASEETEEVDDSSTNANALAGNQNKIIEESVESDVTGGTPLSPSKIEPILDEEAGLSTTVESEVKPMLDEEAGLLRTVESEAEAILDEEEVLPEMEEYDETDGSESTTMINNCSRSVLEVERTKETVLSDDELVDASSTEVLELNSTGSGSQSEDISIAKLFISSGVSLLPHPQKVLTGGKDAYFTCQNWLGVADGVGRWSLEGTNHGVFSKELMDNCREIVSECNDAPITAPEEVLNQAVAKADSPGASTVLIAHFDGQALHVANIGDTGFIILRSNTICQRSSPMMHEFNFPVQIEHGDEPSKLIESYNIDLVEGDVVVIGTDGLFDNLYEQEIASIVSKSLRADKKPEEIAETLAMRAQEIGCSTSARTPFADAAQAAGCGGYNGGKLDDVAVIVSLVNKYSCSLAL